MIIVKVELAMALFSLAYTALNILTRDFLPHLAEQPTCIALDVLVACSHLYFAGHNMHRHVEGRRDRSSGPGA
jgi:hypothetical protein